MLSSSWADAAAESLTNSAWNAGTSDATEDESDYRVWFAVLDGFTRPDHIDAHATTAEPGMPFSIGGEDLMFPGDPNGSDDQVINCRCIVVPRGPMCGGPQTQMGEDELTALIGAAIGDPPELGNDPTEAELDEFDAWLDKTDEETDSSVANICDVATTEEAALMDTTEQQVMDADDVQNNLWTYYQELQDRNSLTYAEDTARSSYISSGYREINRELREGLEHADADAMKDLMARQGFRTDRDITVWRMVDLDKIPGQLAGQLLDGEGTFVERGFFSSATSFDQAQEMAMLFEVDDPWYLSVDVPQGTRALPGSQAEREIILGPGSRFEITDIDEVDQIIFLRKLP